MSILSPGAVTPWSRHWRDGTEGIDRPRDHRRTRCRTRDGHFDEPQSGEGDSQHARGEDRPTYETSSQVPGLCHSLASICFITLFKKVNKKVDS